MYKQRLNFDKQYADGNAEVENPNVTPSYNATDVENACNVLSNLVDGRRAGLRINRCFVSLADIMLTAILVCLIVIINKMRRF